MKDGNEVTVVSWPHDSAPAESLADAVLACIYEGYVTVDHIEEAVFFRRTAIQDELWVVAGMDLTSRVPNGRPLAFEDVIGGDVYTVGLAAFAPTAAEPAAACLRLLEALIEARVGAEWPSRFLVAGLIRESAFSALVRRIKRGLDKNAALARADESDIVKTARELGLSPVPTGTGPHHWRATCPGTPHSLYIQSTENSFGCGWCKRKGGAAELRAFVEERARRRKGEGA